MGRGSGLGVSVVGALVISAKLRPVAARMAGQCLAGMALEPRPLLHSRYVLKGAPFVTVTLVHRLVLARFKIG